MRFRNAQLAEWAKMWSPTVSSTSLLANVSSAVCSANVLSASVLTNQKKCVTNPEHTEAWYKPGLQPELRVGFRAINDNMCFNSQYRMSEFAFLPLELLSQTLQTEETYFVNAESRIDKQHTYKLNFENMVPAEDFALSRDKRLHYTWGDRGGDTVPDNDIDHTSGVRQHAYPHCMYWRGAACHKVLQNNVGAEWRRRIAEWAAAARVRSESDFDLGLQTWLSQQVRQDYPFLRQARHELIENCFSECCEHWEFRLWFERNYFYFGDGSVKSCHGGCLKAEWNDFTGVPNPKRFIFSSAHGGSSMYITYPSQGTRDPSVCADGDDLVRACTAKEKYENKNIVSKRKQTCPLDVTQSSSDTQGSSTASILFESRGSTLRDCGRKKADSISGVSKIYNRGSQSSASECVSDFFYISLNSGGQGTSQKPISQDEQTGVSAEETVAEFTRMPVGVGFPGMEVSCTTDPQACANDVKDSILKSASAKQSLIAAFKATYKSYYENTNADTDYVGIGEVIATVVVKRKLQERRDLAGSLTKIDLDVTYDVMAPANKADSLSTAISGTPSTDTSSTDGSVASQTGGGNHHLLILGG